MLQNFDLELSRGSIPGRYAAKVIGQQAAVADSETVLNGIGTTHYSALTGATLYLSSDDAGDTTQHIQVNGLDQNLAPLSITTTVAGLTKTKIGTTQVFSRVFSVVNLSATPLAGNIYVYETCTVTAGVPQDATKIRAELAAATAATVDGVYTIPAGKTAYIKSFYFSTTGTIATSCDVYTRSKGASAFVKIFHADITNFFVKKANHILDSLPAGTDIELRATGASSTHSVFGTLELYLVDGAA